MGKKGFFLSRCRIGKVMKIIISHTVPVCRILCHGSENINICVFVSPPPRVFLFSSRMAEIWTCLNRQQFLNAHGGGTVRYPTFLICEMCPVLNQEKIISESPIVILNTCTVGWESKKNVSLMYGNDPGRAKMHPPPKRRSSVTDPDP